MIKNNNSKISGHTNRIYGFVIAGTVLAVFGLLLAFDAFQKNDAPALAASSGVFDYTIKQSVNHSISYFPNSFFENGPANNTAYVASLTDKLGATFNYKFSASEQKDLTYTYSAKAVLSGNYVLTSSGKDAASVWSKEYQLLDPISVSERTDNIVVNQMVSVPYSDYKQEIEQVNTALGLATESNVKILFSITVRGSIDGKMLNDTKTSTVTASIGPQIFGVTSDFDGEGGGQIVPDEAQSGIDRASQIEVIVAAILGVLAVGAFIFAWRKRIFKTPYQRELDKIYRYHAGVIVRASQRADIFGRCVIGVNSFDDMLNLEEELKSPIVSTAISPEATSFMILNDDVAYEFILGEPSAEMRAQIERERQCQIPGANVVSAPKSSLTATPPAKPARKSSVKKIQG